MSDGGASSSKRKRRDYTDYARVKAELESLGFTVLSTKEEIAQEIKDGMTPQFVKWRVTRTDEAGTPVERTSRANDLLSKHTKGLSSAERSAAQPFKPGETGHLVRENDAISDLNDVLRRYINVWNAGRGGDDDDDDDDDDTVSFRVTGEEGTTADAICGPDDECRGMQMTRATWKSFEGTKTINKSAQDIVRHLDLGFVFVAACYVNAELVGAYLVVPSEIDIVRQFTFPNWQPTLFTKRKTPEKAKDGPPQQMKQFLSLWKTSADGLVNEDVQRAFASKLYNFVTDPTVKLYTKDAILDMRGKTHAVEKTYMDALMDTRLVVRRLDHRARGPPARRCLVSPHGSGALPVRGQGGTTRPSSVQGGHSRNWKNSDERERRSRLDLCGAVPRSEGMVLSLCCWSHGGRPRQRAPRFASRDKCPLPLRSRDADRFRQKDQGHTELRRRRRS